MLFIYKAKDSSGKIVSGELDAADQRAAVDRLRAMKLALLTIEEQKEESLLARLNPFRARVKNKEVVIFSRQLSTLVSAGVPLVQGLAILEAQASPVFKPVVSAIKADIESGLGIADAMKKHPQVFSTLYVSMIRAGEVGGILDIILERLSAYLEQAESLKAKIKSSMMYPAVLCAVSVMVTVFLLVFVIPTFKNIFAGFGAELPLPTRIVIWLSDGLKANILFILPMPVLLFVGYQKYRATPAGAERIDSLMLKIPVFGELLKKVAIAKFTRTLGTLIKSGVPILQGLETVAATAGNVVIEKVVLSCRESVKEGGKLAEPLRRSDVFPDMVVQMIGVGEETGALDTMLIRIADFYDQEVDTAVKGLTSMIEPLIIVLLGVIIGTIVIAMFLPMFELGNLASKEE